jgi:hypothetical protein
VIALALSSFIATSPSPILVVVLVALTLVAFVLVLILLPLVTISIALPFSVTFAFSFALTALAALIVFLATIRANNQISTDIHWRNIRRICAVPADQQQGGVIGGIGAEIDSVCQMSITPILHVGEEID